MVAGGVLLTLGVLVRFTPGMFSWFGNLPGDLRFESENSRVFIPITSMVVVSIVLTVVVNVIGGFLRDR